MRRQWTYLRDGHFIDSQTAELTSVLLVRLSDNSTFAFVEIRTQRMSMGGFKQRGRVLSFATVKADLPKLQMAKLMVLKLGPAACALFMTGYLLASMVCFSCPSIIIPIIFSTWISRETLLPRHNELHFHFLIGILYP
jgi:hypothetical protein